VVKKRIRSHQGGGGRDEQEPEGLVGSYGDLLALTNKLSGESAGGRKVVVQAERENIWWKRHVKKSLAKKCDLGPETQT